MAHRHRWRDLSIGMGATAGVLVAALLILVFGRIGTLHGNTIRLYVTTDAARGVIRGTEVWLDGQKVGLVRGVDFRPPAASAKNRLVLTLDVLDNARSHLRLDTRVQVRTGGTIIGDQVVYMTSGTAKAREVAPGDTIHAGEQSDLEGMTSDIALASREFPAIIDNVKLLSAQLQSAEGTLGALGAEGGPELRRIRGRTTRLLSRLTGSRGTIGLALGSSDLLLARATRDMAQADSIRTLLGSNQHSLGRFRRDSTLTHEIAGIRDDLSELERVAASPNGTIGRFRADSAITRGIHRDLAALDSLFADLQRHPLRYIAF